MYISPTAYAQKQKTHEVVPTWNYVAVQFRGKMELLNDEHLRSVLEKEV